MPEHTHGQHGTVRNKVKIDFPNLDEAAKKRVQDALSEALQKELTSSVGERMSEGIFGDGSVKGLQ